MANVSGTLGNDFIHVAGDGLTPPPGYTDLPLATDGNDSIYVGHGGDDIVFAGDGDDTINFGLDHLAFNPLDQIDGGPGYDEIVIFRAGTFVFSPTTMVNIEKLSLTGNTGVQYDITLPDAAVASGETLTVIGPSDSSFYSGIFDAGAETDGNIAITISGTIVTGQGDDTINGLRFADTIDAGGGNDIVFGGIGTDSLSLGDGDDVALLKGSLGFDTIDGGDGQDTLQYSVSPGSGTTSVSVDAGTVKLFDNAAENVETVLLNSTEFIDTFRVSGSAGDDTVSIAHQNGFVVVGGLAAEIIVDHTSSNDRVTVRGLGGEDVIDASAALGNDVMLTIEGGDGDDVLTGGLRLTLLDGGAGEDLADYRGETGDILVVMRGRGSVLSITGLARAILDSIEGVLGGLGDDLLSGDSLDNLLDGGGGDDLLKGGDGDDVLHGGDGVDTADYRDETSAVVVGLNGSADTTVTVGGIVEDTIGGIENVLGSSGADTLVGDSEDNQFTGFLGNDSLDGGSGLDTADYREKTGAVAVALNGASNVVVTVDGLSEDTIRNIENLLSGAGDDTLTGDALANRFSGGGGEDSLKGGGGKDLLDGEGGVDTADYRDKTGAVVVALNGATDATVTVGGLAEDTLRNIENIEGGSGADRLGGDSLANRLSGNAGGDSLNGGAGDDFLDGGDGKDALDGGLGADTANYQNKTASIAVTLNGSNSAIVTVGGAAEDTLRGVEHLLTGSGHDTLEPVFS